MGGAPHNNEEFNKIRFSKIEQFLLIGNQLNFFIEPKNFETLSDVTPENKIYNKLKHIIGSDKENFKIKISLVKEFFMESPNYKIFIEMLAKFINIEFCIEMIHSNSSGFDVIGDIDSISYDFDKFDGIKYISGLNHEYLSPIITSFNDTYTSYEYYLTLDTNIFRRNST